MYMYKHSDYLSLGANNGNQNHYCFFLYKNNVFNCNVLYFIHTEHGPHTKTLQLILINYIAYFIPIQSRPS